MKWVKRDPVESLLGSLEITPEMRETMRYIAESGGIEKTPKFPDYNFYACWILSRKHYGKTRKYR